MAVSCRRARASRQELATFARERAVLRPGFERLVAACQQARAPFVLCSAGLDVYIEPVLERLPRALRAHVQVRCNGATCSPEGLAMTFHGAGTPLEADGCGACGFCKAAIVRELQAAGYQVVGIGDGTSDRCLAPAADVLFARGRLTEYCRARAIPFTPFETFDEVLAHLPPRAKRSLSG